MILLPSAQGGWAGHGEAGLLDMTVVGTSSLILVPEGCSPMWKKLVSQTCHMSCLYTPSLHQNKNGLYLFKGLKDRKRKKKKGREREKGRKEG
jgi:hypothetical protein